MISTRGLVETRTNTGVSTDIDRDWLEEQVLVEGLTPEQIAARCSGVTPANVRREMERHGIAEPSSRRVADPRRAQELDTEIRKTAVLIRRAWIHLASRLHELHEGEHYRELGHDSFTSYLESIELDRSHAYRLLRIHKALVVEHGVDPKRLEGVSSEKVDIAIRPGVKHVEELLEDVTTMTPAELRAKYKEDPLAPVEECPTCNRPLPRRRPQPRQFPSLADVDWLRERYLERAMTQQEIAAELGCAQPTVGQALRRHGIPTRPAMFGKAAQLGAQRCL